jgi:hypothetical protein
METIVSDVIISVVDSFFPKGTDSLSETENKEDECTDQQTVSDSHLSCLLSLFPEGSLASSDKLRAHLLEVVRLLKERSKLREAQLDRIYQLHTLGAVHSLELLDLFDIDKLKDQLKNQQQSVKDQSHIAH